MEGWRAEARGEATALVPTRIVFKLLGFGAHRRIQVQQSFDLSSSCTSERIHFELSDPFLISTSWLNKSLPLACWIHWKHSWTCAAEQIPPLKFQERYNFLRVFRYSENQVCETYFDCSDSVATIYCRTISPNIYQLWGSTQFTSHSKILGNILPLFAESLLRICILFSLDASSPQQLEGNRPRNRASFMMDFKSFRNHQLIFIVKFEPDDNRAEPDENEVEQRAAGNPRRSSTRNFWNSRCWIIRRNIRPSVRSSEVWKEPLEAFNVLLN